MSSALFERPLMSDSLVYKDWFVRFFKWYQWMQKIGFDKDDAFFQKRLDEFEHKCEACYIQQTQKHLDSMLFTWQNHELLISCNMRMDMYVHTGKRNTELDDHPPLPQAEVSFILTQFYCFCLTWDSAWAHYTMEQRVKALEGGPKTAAPGATPAHSAGRKPRRTVSGGRKPATATPTKTPAHAFLAGLDISQHMKSAQERARSHPGTMDLSLLLKNLDFRKNGEVISDGLGRVTDGTSSLQMQYHNIVEQLNGFLNSEDLESAIKCITSKNLEENIKEIDDKWMGLRERQAVTLERLKTVVNTILQGIFCGEGHIFYVQIRNLDKDSVYLYPTTQTDNTFQYRIPDQHVYSIDIKDLSGNMITPNLYAYESDGSLVEDTPNPFNLTNPRVLGDRGSHGPIKKYLAYGFRLYAFGLDAEDNHLELTLTNDTDTTVLKLQFYYRSARYR